jgi:uncharacterized protein YdaU (DUF1376 family)
LDVSKTDTWMPLFVADYLADTRRLSTLEHGAYLLLLMEYWKHGPLADDDAELATITGMDRKLWAKEVGPRIRRFFQVHDDGLLHQKRIDSERRRASEISEKRRAAAMQRGSKRVDNDEQTGINEEAIAEQLVGDSSHVASGLDPPLSRDLSQLHKESKQEPDLRSGAGNGAVKSGLSARDALWRDGPPIVRDLLGTSDRQTRNFLGGLTKLAHDDCSTVYAALREAESLRPIEPQAWLRKACTPRSERTAKAPEGVDPLIARTFRL